MVDKKRLSKSILSGVLVGGLLLGSCGAALAQSTSGAANTQAATSSIQREAGFHPGRGLMEATLSDLVKQGTLSQDQADKLLDFLKQQKPEAQAPFGELVKQGVLTQQEAETISQKIRQAEQTERDQEMKAAIEALVAAGTIDQSKADQLLTLLQQRPAEKKAAQTGDQSNQPKAQGPFGYAVEQGVLTQEQADALAKQLHAREQSKQEEQLKTILEELVAAGTINQSQATEILSLREQSNQPAPRQGFWETLVEQGVLTQEQADAIGQKMHEAMQSERLARIKSALADLVTAGTIDQSKAEQVISCLQNQEAKQKGTPSQQAKDSTKPDLLTEAVKQGIITQDQADAISKALPAKPATPFHLS